ncbi:unnamed protein product [Orchesella dallaii]|uniref:Uncharacterized protein n=1 Tax=Orchesella dallaii TaxID=48710 RepID=A0ABP1QL43_9HEXA
MFTPGPVFCQLPHLKWPTACKLVRVFEENVTDQDKKKCIQKAEIACGDQWITLITIKEFGLGCPSTLNNRVTIPIHLMQSCVHPDVSQNGVSLDASLGNQEGRNWVGYRDKRFNFRPIKNLMQGTNVVMSSQKYFHFGKVFFTGTDASVPLKQKTTESDINIFVAFLQPIEDFKYHLLQEVDDWGYVYRVPWPRLIFLKDFTKLMERAEESVLRLEKHPSGMLEVRCESKNLSFCHNEVLSSHASPLPPRTDPGSASGRSPTSQFSTEVNSHGITNGLTSKHHSQMNDSPRPSPLTRSKMSSDPEFNKDNKLKFLQGTNKSTYADILTKHSTKSCIGVNGLPKESTSNSGRHVSDSENNKSVMANNEDVSIFRPCRKSNSNKDGGMQFKLFEENRKAKAKSSETKRSEASYFKADCFAMDKKHTLKYVEGMSLQDAVIASMSSANSIGEIDMFCTIGDESIIYAAVTFDTPLQYPFFVQHNKEYCFDRCRNDTFVLIPMNLLMKSVQGTDSLYLIRNTDNVSIPSQCMKENGTKSRNYQTEASTNGIFVKDAIQGDKKSTHDLHGIEGSDNSCYVDSVIFSFFAFSTLFDHCLESPNKKNPEQAEHNISICKILKYNVVSILRATGGLRSNAIQELRHALSIYNPSFVGDWMGT